MDRGYEKEQFKSLSIKASVADKFNKFCKEMSLSKSMTLLVMIEFFQENKSCLKSNTMFCLPLIFFAP